MDLNGFPYNFGDIVSSSAPVEMNRHWMLPCRDADDRGRRAEECGVRCKVRDTKCGRHY
jgi:hypothetical protein